MGVLVGLLAGSALAAPADPGPGVVVKDLGLSARAETGTVRHGFTHHGGGGAFHRVRGWYRVVAEGNTPFIADPVNKPAEVSQAPYLVYYYTQYTTCELGGLTAESLADRPWLEVQKGYNGRLREIMVGDGGLVGEGDNPTKIEARAVRGPLRVMVTLYPRLLVYPDGGRRGPALNQEGNLTSLTERLTGNDGRHYPEQAKLLGLLKQAYFSAPQAATALAESSIRQWDRWESRAVARGPGLKGTWLDLRACWPRPEEAPAGLLPEGRLPENKPQGYVGLQYNNRDKSERYAMYVTALPYEHNHLYADGPLQVAQGEFLQKSRWETTQEKNVTKPLALPGADEAARHVRPYAEVVMFRLANVVCSVRCDHNKQGAATQAEALARIVLAKLLKQQVDRQPLADKPDLRLEPHLLDLSAIRHSQKRGGAYQVEGFLQEPASDQQALSLVIQNRGEGVATNVRVQWSVTLAGQGTPEPLGEPQVVPDIEPSARGYSRLLWDLKGANVEGATISATVYCEGLEDANPADNITSVTASIYYAHNGKRAFCWKTDAYKFNNYGWEGREVTELVEGVVTTIMSNARSANPVEEKLLAKLASAVIYERGGRYFKESVMAGDGGHCQGMAASMALYFENDALRPRPGLTCEYELEEASLNINLYHRNQLLPLMDSVIQNRLYFPEDKSVTKALRGVRESLQTPHRRCIIVGLYGKGGHAMLAYKLIEVEGRPSVAYLADPNCPPASLSPSDPLQQIVFLTEDNGHYIPHCDYSQWARQEGVTVSPVQREMPVEQANALVQPLKQAIYDLAPALHKAGQFLALVRCPVDAVFTDAQARRTGILNGKVVNEIPGATVAAEGVLEVYRLPGKETYQVQITATGDGKMDLDFIRALTPHSAELKAFEEVPVRKGAVYTMTIAPGGLCGPLQAGDQQLTPDFTGTLLPPSLLGD
jgi:hypothetical protein